MIFYEGHRHFKCKVTLKLENREIINLLMVYTDNIRMVKGCDGFILLRKEENDTQTKKAA